LPRRHERKSNAQSPGGTTPRIQKFRDGGIEIVTGAMIPPDFTTFWNQARQRGFKPRLHWPQFPMAARVPSSSNSPTARNAV
jgi:hypothetical protein